jgi:hypothetical protein
MIILLNLCKKIIKGGARVGVDSSTEGVVVAAKTLKNVPDQLISIKRLSCSSEFRSNILHLGKVLVSRESIIEGRTQLLHPGLGRGRHVSKNGSPCLGRCLKPHNMCKHIGRERIEDPAEHQLITRDPGNILRVFNGHLLFVDVLHLQKLLRCLLVPFNQIKNTGTTKSRDHKSLPDQRVFPRERLRGWRSKRCSENHGG